MDQFGGPLSYLPEAERQWTSIYNEAKKLLMCYQSLLIFYVKAHYREDWGRKLGRNAMSPWTPVDVLDEIIHQRTTLISIGASYDFFEVITSFKEALVEEPESDSDRAEFCELLNRLIEVFPFNSLREKRVGAVPQDHRRLIEIEPNYYKSEFAARLSAMSVNDHIESYFKADVAEKQRVRALTMEEFMKEFIRTEEPSQEANPDNPDSDQITTNGGLVPAQKAKKSKSSMKSKGRRKRRCKGLGRKSYGVRTSDHGSGTDSIEIVRSGTETSSPSDSSGSEFGQGHRAFYDLSGHRRKRKADRDHFEEDSEEEEEDFLESTPPVEDGLLAALLEGSHTPDSPVAGNSSLEFFSGATDQMESPPRTPIQRRKVTRRHECTEIEEAPTVEEE